MTLQKFTEKFLPGYDNRYKLYYAELMDMLERTELPDGFGTIFWEDNFPETLQNFADKICKKQRKICAEHHDATRHPYGACYGIIKNAPQPKIED